MKFLIDEQLTPALVPWLIRHGHEAAHVTTLLGWSTPDVRIAAHCESRGLTLLTKDRDYADLRAQERFCVVWLRWGNLGNRRFFELFEAAWPDIEHRMSAGERLIQVR